MPASKQEKSAEDTLVSALEGPPSFSETKVTGDRFSGPSFAAPLGLEETESEIKGAATEQDTLPDEALESLRIRTGILVFSRKPRKLLNEIDRRIDQKEEPDLPSFPWMEQFRNAIRQLRSWSLVIPSLAGFSKQKGRPVR